MKQIIDGILRLTIAGYMLVALAFSGYRPNFEVSSHAVLIGRIIGTIIAFYFLFTFWGYNLIQGIKSLEKKETRKIKYVSIPSFIATILLIISHLYSMTKFFILNGFRLNIVLYIIIIGILVYLSILDFKILRKNKSKSLNLNE